jgi:hypothetical protein
MSCNPTCSNARYPTPGGQDRGVALSRSNARYSTPGGQNCGAALSQAGHLSFEECAPGRNPFICASTKARVTSPFALLLSDPGYVCICICRAVLKVRLLVRFTDPSVQLLSTGVEREPSERLATDGFCGEAQAILCVPALRNPYHRLRTHTVSPSVVKRS